MTDARANSLAYVSRPTGRPFSYHWLRVGFGCGAVPLVAGTVVTGLWLLTYHPALPLLGLSITVLGVVLVLAGLAALASFTVQTYRTRPVPFRRWLLQIIVVGLLLLANLPAALSCAVLASISRVKIVNNSQQTVSSVAFLNPQYATTVGPIPAGATYRFYWKAQPDSDILFSANVGGITATGVALKWPITIGRDVTISFEADGTCTVE